MPATGLTVSRGTTPEPFDAEVLGVLDDGVAPGVDLVLVEVDSPAIDRAGGIWAGMSGSPVYDDAGRLVGALAYGFSATSRIGGVTPAEDMQRLLDLGGPSARAALARTRVRLPAALRREVAARPGVTAREAAQGLERLPVPLAVSGLRTARLDALAERITGARVVPHRASAAPARAADPGAIIAGGNFAAAVSYGDVTAAGVGTTTAVCGSRPLAFGHPFTFRGAGSLSAHPATALAIVDDPVFGPYKLANPGGVVGEVDQDRLVGLRAALDRAPVPTPVTSTVTDLDEGTSRDGATWVNEDVDVPDIVPFHLLANIDRVFDRIGSGRSRVTWTVTGRAGDEPFALTRDDRFTARATSEDPFGADISVASIGDLAQQLLALGTNPFAPVVFTGVRIDAQVAREIRELRVEGLDREEGGAWVPVAEDEPLQVRTGLPLRLRVRLGSFRGTAGSPTVELTLPVPAAELGTTGSLLVRGGADPGGGEEPPASGSEAASFADLLAELADVPHNDDLVAELRLPEEDPEGGEGPAAAAERRLGEVVTGALAWPVEVVE